MTWLRPARRARSKAFPPREERDIGSYVVAAKLQNYPVVSLSSPLILRDTYFS